MATPDVTVLGAGVFGLSCAWACLRRGANVEVVERDHVGAGASGGILGACAPHVPENWNEKKAFQFKSLLMADRFWRDVDRASGLSSGFARHGRLQPINSERELNRAEMRAGTAQELWEGQASWTIVAADEFGDWAPATQSGMLIHDTLSARLNPKHACQSLARAIQNAGGAVRENTQPEGMPTAAKIIDATGYNGLLHLSETFSQPIGSGEKGQAILLQGDHANRPQIFVDGLHIVPHENATIAIGSTSERHFDDPGTTDEQLDHLLRKALEALPFLKDYPILTRWAGIRPRAKSRAPILGPWPGRPDVYIANGGFKIGFGLAPLIGEVMADLVLDGRDTIPDGFRVSDNLN